MLTPVPIECAQARESASGRLDGELPELDDVRLAAHLSGCADCRAYAGEFAALTTELRSAPLERPGIEIFARRSRGVPAFRVQAAAAAAVLIAAAAGSSFALGRALGGGSGSRPTAVIQSALSVRADSAQQHLLAMLSRVPASPYGGASARTGQFRPV